MPQDTTTLWPNLFIVGAMKCGTTTLHNLLGQHPQIHMCERPKEPNYFATEAPTDARLQTYLSLFEGHDDARWRGESSTNYSKLPRVSGVVQRLHQREPQARIIYIMRDPVLRAISHYWWQVQWSAEGRPMAEVLRTDPEILDVSNYAMQLQPYVERFGQPQVYTLTLEELQADPALQLQRLFAWLQVDTSVAADLTLRKDNSSQSEVHKVIGSGYLARLKGTWAWNTAKQIVNPAARRRAMAWLSRPVKRQLSPQDLQDSLAILRPQLRASTRTLEQMLGRPFPEWTCLWSDTELPATAES